LEVQTNLARRRGQHGPTPHRALSFGKLGVVALHPLILACALGALSLATACDTVPPIQVDPEVAPWEHRGAGIEVPDGELLVEMGSYADALYYPFEDSGSPLVIVNGVQGGEWIMPAVRMVGGESKAVILCSLTTEVGEIVGESFTTVKLFPAVDGWLEIKFYPIRIKRDAAHALEPLDDLFGADATLEISITDDADRVGTVSYQVTLASE
jgi:hypothetical protein